VITNPPENAPKTGERIISAIVVGILGISMLVLSIVMNKKRKAEK
jgi:LPXTG-motif cell wall-anchored protein